MSEFRARLDNASEAVAKSQPNFCDLRALGLVGQRGEFERKPGRWRHYSSLPASCGPIDTANLADTGEL
jgi:hypothetical protein